MSRDRLVALSVVPLLLGFAALIGAAMALYPGGTWEDPGREGHSFVFNYLCDLMRPVALNGRPNPHGARLTEWGLLFFTAALVPFFWIAPRAFPDRPRAGRLVRGCGIAAGVFGVAVVLTPSHRVGEAVHGAITLATAVPALIAAVASTWALFRRRGSLFGLAAGTLVSTAAAVVVYAVQLAVQSPSTLGLAALQKIALLLASAWMLFTVRLAVLEERPR